MLSIKRKVDDLVCGVGRAHKATLDGVDAVIGLWIYRGGLS